MKIRLLLSVISFLMVFYSCSSKKSENTDEIIPVKVVELKKEKIQKGVNVSGIFTTDDETNLSFKIGGIVKSISVNEGDIVKKGQLLASLELNEIQSQVSQAESAYDKAKRDFNRVQNLYKDSVATLAQMQDAKTGMDIAFDQLNIARYNLNRSEICASSDGYILKKFVNEGQLISAGSPVLQTNGAGKGNWILKAGISDHDWSIVKLGDRAVINSDVDPLQDIEALVLRKSEGIDAYSGTFLVELKITSKSPVKIASGLFGKAKIFPQYASQMWVIPYQSILEGDGNNGFVFITNDLKTVSKIEVKIFDLDKDSVYINQGLDNCKYLIVSGSAYLNDNSKINIDNK